VILLLSPKIDMQSPALHLADRQAPGGNEAQHVHGVISGTPTVRGTYTFTAQALIKNLTKETTAPMEMLQSGLDPIRSTVVRSPPLRCRKHNVCAAGRLLRLPEYFDK